MLSPTENVKDDIQHSIQQIYLKRYELVKVFCGKEWNNDMSNKTTGVDGRGLERPSQVPWPSCVVGEPD